MTEKLNGAEAMVQMLQAHGVRHMFGLAGDTTLPFYDALLRMDHGITHVMTRDERSATYMADGYSRVTGRSAWPKVHRAVGPPISCPV